MTIILAFYQGKGNWIDWCIRTATRSRFSHVEIFKGSLFANEAECFSSSARDGGVRRKHITFKQGHWHLVKVVFTHVLDEGLFNEAEGAGYDHYGIAFSQLLNLRRHNKDKWFCSELCAAMLGLSAPETYSPARLSDTVCQLNHAWDSGRRNASS